MDDRVLVEVLVPSDELFHDDDALRFRQLLSLFQDFFEGAFVTELLEEVDVVG